MAQGSPRERHAEDDPPSWGAPPKSTRSSGSSTSSTTAVRVRWNWSASRELARRACSPSSRLAAEQRGHLVLAGSASELERELPFSVFVHALDQYVEGLDPDSCRLSATTCKQSSRTSFRRCPALAGHRAVALQHERYRSHRAVRALLEHLALTRPLVLVLDDFHWADSASVELLGALLRRPPAAPVLTAFALRPRQTPERLASRARASASCGGADPGRARRSHAG